MATKTNASSTRRLVVIGGYTTLIFGFALLSAMPLLRRTNAARNDIQQLTADMELRQIKGKELEDLKLRVAAITKETQVLPRLLPPDQDLGTFLKDLVARSDKAGLADVSVRNLAPITLDRSQKLPIEVHARGTYAQFRSFLLSLEKMDRLPSIGKLVVESGSDMSGTLEVQLTLFIYNTKPAAVTSR